MLRATKIRVYPTQDL